MTYMRGADVVERLEPAIQAGLIISGAPGELRFSHAVVSEALYDATPPAQRMQLHYEIAETMEKHHAAIAAHRASIAHHYLLALPFAPAEKAVEAARVAAQTAVARSCVRRRCAALTRSAIDASRSARQRAAATWSLLLGLGDAFGRAGDADDSKAAFLDAIDRLRDIGCPSTVRAGSIGLCRAVRVVARRRRHSASYRCFARRSTGSRTTTAGSGCGCSRGSRARCVTTSPRCRGMCSVSKLSKRPQNGSTIASLARVRAPRTLVCDLGA